MKTQKHNQNVRSGKKLTRRKKSGRRPVSERISVLVQSFFTQNKMILSQLVSTRDWRLLSVMPQLICAGTNM